jgi:hypothetical protein
MNRNFIRASLLFGAVGLFACSDNPTVTREQVAPTDIALDAAFKNGTGACMGDNAFASGFTSGMGSASDLNCTANDIDIAFATVTEYSFTSSTSGFQTLPSGQTIECTGGQTIYVRTHAFLQNNAQERYDIGLWVATDGGDAVTGTCNHYALNTNDTGVSSLEADHKDTCGDMAAGVLTDVDLDVLTLTCPTSGATSLSVGACVGWQNSDDFNQRGLCPTTPPGGTLGFRLGTVPETKAKCNCEPFSLPILVRASLTLRKTITNDNGGTATVTNFPLTATGPNTISGVSGTTAVTARPVLGGTYALTEQTVANYTAGSWSCVGGTQSGANISVSPGGSATCTINNNDNPASLTLVKVVTNDNGGTATAANFNLTATGPRTVTGAGPTVTNANVAAGVYNLSESGPSGYTASSWSCTSGGSGSTVTLPLGGSATCTIGNNDNPASLTLVKVVTNNNGGTATAANFNLTAAGPTTISGAGPTVTGAASAGLYNLSESGPSGYTASSWSCSSGGSGSTVTLPVGGSATCTIGNNDNPASLTLVKVVTNDNGGTATAANFNLTAAGPITISGAGPTVTNANANAGVYNLSESGPSGYTASSWSCTSGGSGASVTLPLGGSATCTIGNNDNPASLTLVKVVTNDNGGTSTASAFTLRAAGPTTISGAGPTVTSAASAGLYNLSETGPSGYTASSWNCTSGGSGATVTLPLGGSATCTIGNNDNPASLTLVKVVTNDNGGTATPAAFTLRAAGPITISGVGPTVTNANASAGTYNLSETSVAGYTPSSWSCTSGGSGATVTLPLGGSSTCTIGNNDQPATLTLVKRVIGIGGTTFTFNLTGVTPTSTTLAPAANSTSSATYTNVSAGSKTITEVLPNANYILTDVACVRSPSTTPFVTGNTSTGLISFTLTLGDNVTCTYVNQRTSQTTRTQGFWSTHLEVTTIVWNGGTIQGTVFGGISSVLDNQLCGQTLDIAAVMGGFWSSIAQTTDKEKRSDVDRARMRLLQQLLAAELNYAAFGSLPPGGLTTFTNAEAAYCSGDIDAMNLYAGILAAFNESGDTGAFDTGFSASPKDAKAIANLEFWDDLP